MSQSKAQQAHDFYSKKHRSTLLRTRLVVFVLLMALTPLIGIATRDTLVTQQALKTNAEEALKSSATQTANSLDVFLQTRLNSIATEALFNEFVTFLSLAPKPPSIVRAYAFNLLKKLKENDNDYVISYALLDPNGNVILETAGGINQDSEAEELYFSEALSSAEPIVSTITYSNDGKASVTFAAKILDTNLDRDILGILRVKYDPAILQDLIVGNAGSSPSTSVLLLDQFDIRMADSQNPELVLKSIIPLEPEAYLLAVQTHRLLDIPAEEQATNYVEFKSALDNAANEPLFTADITPNTPGDDTVAVAFLETQPWSIVYSRPTDVVLADVQQQIRTNIILVIVISILITILATYLVIRLASPIISLTKTAEAISAGDLSVRSGINTDDEIGLLANTFDMMSSEIQELVSGLERHVEERTSELKLRGAELEKAIEQSKKHANELQTIAEIGQYLSTEKELEFLLPLITRTVSERFGFYHVGIFLLNESRKYAVLRAANSPGGQKMLDRQHKLEVGQVGIVGDVTATGIPRIALDTGKDAIFFNNPDLPETHSEMALPLVARGVIIGALDVQSTDPNAFTESDVATLNLLADQIAIAIDNVRLLEESQKALEESQTLFREYLAEAWQKKTTTEIMGYHQTLTGGQVITGREFDKISGSNGDEQDTLTVPIKLRDQVIGTLNIRPNAGSREWSEDEVNIAQAVTERLGLALDNARLFEETSSRASRERLVTDITTKIRSTTDPQEMISTAVEELRRVLNVKKIEIVPGKLRPQQDE